MSTTQVTYKHRATQPLPPVERASKAGAHRDPRTMEYVIAAVLTVVLATLLIVLLGRS
jgi:hypothetical protein